LSCADDAERDVAGRLEKGVRCHRPVERTLTYAEWPIAKRTKDPGAVVIVAAILAPSEAT
jgi:hypothetical protein